MYFQEFVEAALSINAYKITKSKKKANWNWVVRSQLYNKLCFFINHSKIEITVLF